MNVFFLIAGILCYALGLIHSILGELLIFNSKRSKGSIVPSIGTPELKESQLRIIWATWHLASIFGWCIGTIILGVSIKENGLNSNLVELVIQAVIYTMLLSSLLVFIGTKRKHPGWIVLLIISILLAIGNT